MFTIDTDEYGIIVDADSLPDDLTQEELDAIVDAIKSHVENGTLESHSIELTEEEVEYFDKYISSKQERKLN